MLPPRRGCSTDAVVSIRAGQRQRMPRKATFVGLATVEPSAIPLEWGKPNCPCVGSNDTKTRVGASDTTDGRGQTAQSAVASRQHYLVSTCIPCIPFRCVGAVPKEAESSMIERQGDLDVNRLGFGR